jgi:cytoskeleton protein RodZ
MSEGTTADVTAGALLRQAREASGLHVATLAANLKVPVRKLEALEEDRYDLLGDAVFVRALASSVCRTLKADPQPVLQRLPQTAQPRLVQDSEGINAPFRAPSDGPSPGIFDSVSKPVIVTIVLLLLGTLVITFLPMVQKGYETVVQANSSSVPPPAANDPVLPPGVSTTAPAEPRGADVLPASAPTAAPAMPTQAPAPMATTVAPTAPAPLAPASQPATATNVAAVPAADATANGIVVFRTRGPSWIQVTDAGGTTVLRRLMGPGESAGASGRLPLSVTVGDAGQTDVQVRGKPYNLGSVSKDNVARFEVN